MGICSRSPSLVHGFFDSLVARAQADTVKSSVRVRYIIAYYGFFLHSGLFAGNRNPYHLVAAFIQEPETINRPKSS